jgi:hypothetical protein
MDPALAARIRARVRGRRPEVARPGIGRVKVFAWARVAGVACVAALVVALLHRRTRAEDAILAKRALLLASVESVGAPLTERDLAAEARMETWLSRASVREDADFVAAVVRTPKGLAEILEQGSVYVRGAAADLSNAAGIRRAAEASVKDAFLACLLSPPRTRSEGALMARVYDVYGGGAERQTGQVARLHDVQVGLPFLEAAWRGEVARAATLDDIERLRRDFEQAPVAAARRGATARLLVFAMDESSDATGPAELDGERPHTVRVGLVDLASDALLLRMKRRVDPGKVSAERRPLYANGIDSCALAFDVRESALRAN